MKLLADIARCAGRFGLAPDDPICPRREQCARYVALMTSDGADETGEWNRISVFAGLCRDGEDHMIPIDGAPLRE